MDRYETLALARDARGVLTITLNRPDKKNALSGQMIADLTHIAEVIEKDKDIRVAVLRGAGDVFCAGGDLGWMRQQIDSDREGRMREASKLAHMLRVLNELRVPLIGVLHGGAFGGGVGMACVCDIALAEDHTNFGLTETRLGLIPATISPYVIARMGEGKARQVFMSARIFSAQEAIALNLIAAHLPKDDLEARVEAEVTPYLSVAPEAVAASKSLARLLGPRIDDQVIEETITRLCDTWEGDEAKEGIDAFLTKRKPRWA